MKKFIWIGFVILLIGSAIYVMFNGDEEVETDLELWTYILSEDGESYLIESYNGNQQLVTIEETYQGKPVTGFDTWFFFKHSNLKKLRFSINLEEIDFDISTSLGQLEFEIPYDSKLKKIGCEVRFNRITNTSFYIPKDASICLSSFSFNSTINDFIVHPDNPFYKDIDGILFSKDQSTLIFYPSEKKTEEYSIPSFVNSIEQGAFLGQRYLKTLNVPETVTEIGDRAFSYSSLEEVNFSPTTTISDLGYQSFAYTYSLQTFVVPDSVTELNGTFHQSGIDSISFGEESQLTYIGVDTFSETMRLRSLTLPKNLETVEHSPFLNSSIEELFFQSNLINIDPYSFQGLNRVQSITFTVPQSNIAFENHVMTINEGKELILYLPAENEAATLYINQHVETIHYDYAINRKFNLDRIEVDPMNTHFKSVNGVLFSHDLSQLLLYPYTSTYVSYEIPDGTEEVISAFRRPIHLKEIIIPESVTTLPIYAFSGSYIDSVTFSGESKLEVIPEGAFSYTLITDIVIPKSVLIIDRYAFSNTPLVNLEFEEGTQIINIRAFAFQEASIVNLALPPADVVISVDAFVYNPYKNVFIPKEIFSIAQGTFSSNPDVTFFLEGPRAGRNLYLPDEPFTVLYNQSYQDYLEAIDNNS